MADLGPAEWLVNAWLAATFNPAAPFSIPGVYLQLHTGLPGAAGTANVLADTDRQPVAFSAADDGTITTAGAAAEYLIGDDGTVTHGSLWTALESGTWFWNVIATHPVTVVEGDVLTLSDGLTFTLDGWV